MPSGISHMLLSRYLPIEKSKGYLHKRNFFTRYFQIGSIAPDLPYASVADYDFFHSEVELADLFHFAKSNQDVPLSPNRLPLLSMQRIKTLTEQENDRRECDSLFWFFAGYASHVIADGIFHPFVMDKVGKYEGSNKADHRALEMGIDVLVLKHFTQSSGHAIESSYAGFDSQISEFNELKYANSIHTHFSNLINTIYGIRISPGDIKGWISGISNLFCLCTGKWPGWVRNIKETCPFVFREIKDVEKRADNYLILTKPRFWEDNFRHSPAVDLLNDCLPQFNKTMAAYLEKAYAYVYESGAQLTDLDLPAFSLDTGRTADDPNNVAITPLLWQVT